MKTFTPKQWILIDLAHVYGNTGTYEERLAFGYEMLNVMQFIDYTSIPEIKRAFHHWINEAKEPEMFCAALIAMSDALQDKDSGFLIGLDACASGPQLLSVLCRCVTGMESTGALNTGKVPNLYKTIQGHMGINTPVAQIKSATVPHVYGSTAAPENVFGDDLPKFIQAYIATVPCAEWAKNVLINSWNPEAEFHEWQTPDGAWAHVKVIDQKDYKGKFLDFSYTYRTAVNQAVAKGKGVKSLGANATHSYDGYIVRELQRRCNYDPQKVVDAIHVIDEAGDRAILPSKLRELETLTHRFKTVSLVALEYIDKYSVRTVSKDYLTMLKECFIELLQYPPHDVVTVH